MVTDHREKEEEGTMKTLVVEDDFTSRKMLQLMLLPLGECDIAVEGAEAIAAFRSAAAEGKQYDLICLDIMMPELDGHTVLTEIRKMEEEAGISGRDGVRVIMTTALSDSKNILKAFDGQCEAYLVKPIEKRKLFETLRILGLLSE
jgi:two-component system, chemotaxis family, chemotaxis protein CheY